MSDTERVRFRLCKYRKITPDLSNSNYRNGKMVPLLRGKIHPVPLSSENQEGIYSDWENFFD